MVYFVLAQGCNKVKIGVTSNVHKRLLTLSSYCPFPLRLLGTIEAGLAYDLESSLHEKFSEFKVHGEWYEDARSIRLYIAENCDGNIGEYSLVGDFKGYKGSSPAS